MHSALQSTVFTALTVAFASAAQAQQVGDRIGRIDDLLAKAENALRADIASKDNDTSISDLAEPTVPDAPTAPDMLSAPPVKAVEKALPDCGLKLDGISDEYEDLRRRVADMGPRIERGFQTFGELRKVSQEELSAGSCGEASFRGIERIRGDLEDLDPAQPLNRLYVLSACVKDIVVTIKSDLEQAEGADARGIAGNLTRATRLEGRIAGAAINANEANMDLKRVRGGLVQLESACTASNNY